MPPEMITADFLEKSNGFKEPILVRGDQNPRVYAASEDLCEQPIPSGESEEAALPHGLSEAHFEYETVVDDGQDRLDMVIPRGLTVRRVAELYGPNEPVPVIDVKAQEGEGKKWTMSKWADYYEQQGEKPVRNVISLEVSRSRLGKLIRRPKAVRDMDLQDAVWREDDKFAPPPVQFYCLMSVADCFTDFHIDFGGSSVYYHIVKGRKVFFFIPPTKTNLKKYEDWCLSPNQGHEWLGKQVKECYRVDLYPGDTMLIPSGWIHAVWTPEDSLVIGGNFLTRIHYGMQIKILEIEKSTKVAIRFRYPFFQKIMWLTVIKYLEEDPVPEAVQQLLQAGEQFSRALPIYCEPDKFGHNSHLGPTNYNRRYYSKHELEGLTDLLNYIWRTVLISLDKIDLPQRTRNAVAKSIPKGFGDPLVLARRFAMWIAWKRGNENIPSWTFADAGLPDVAEAGEKKLSAAQLKKLERESLHEILRATAERSSARIKATEPPPPPPMLSPPPSRPSPPLGDQTPPDTVDDFTQLDMYPGSGGPITGFLRPSPNNPHITTPKTSQLGPKRVACDACRKRRIRCKHKDELIDTSKPGMHTIDLSGSYGISVKRRLSDHSVADGQTNAVNGPSNGGPIMADVNGDPYALKSGRVKACADCRKSKVSFPHELLGIGANNNSVGAYTTSTVTSIPLKLTRCLYHADLPPKSDVSAMRTLPHHIKDRGSSRATMTSTRTAIHTRGTRYQTSSVMGHRYCRISPFRLWTVARTTILCLSTRRFKRTPVEHSQQWRWGRHIRATATASCHRSNNQLKVTCRWTVSTSPHAMAITMVEVLNHIHLGRHPIMTPHTARPTDTRSPTRSMCRLMSTRPKLPANTTPSGTLPPQSHHDTCPPSRRPATPTTTTQPRLSQTTTTTTTTSPQTQTSRRRPLHPLHTTPTTHTHSTTTTPSKPTHHPARAPARHQSQTPGAGDGIAKTASKSKTATE